HLVEGPIHEYSLAVDEASVHHAPGAAVVGRTAVIAKHIVSVRGHVYFRVGVMIAVLLWNIIFVQPLPIHDDHAVVDDHLVSGQPNDALDVRFGLIQRKPENHHVAALDVSYPETVGKLIDEDPLLVGQGGHHARAFHFHRLVDEDNEDNGKQDRNGGIAQPGGWRHRT